MQVWPAAQHWTALLAQEQVLPEGQQLGRECQHVAAAMGSEQSCEW